MGKDYCIPGPMADADAATPKSAATEQAHTPGPWSVERERRSGHIAITAPIIQGGGAVCTMAEIVCDNREANARLISCAPEMAKMIANLLAALGAQAAGADWLQPKIDRTREAAIALLARATNAPPVSDGAGNGTASATDGNLQARDEPLRQASEKAREQGQ